MSAIISNSKIGINLTAFQPTMRDCKDEDSMSSNHHDHLQEQDGAAQVKTFGRRYEEASRVRKSTDEVTYFFTV